GPNPRSLNLKDGRRMRLQIDLRWYNEKVGVRLLPIGVVLPTWNPCPLDPGGTMKPALLLYDATCRFCTQSAARAAWLRPRGGLRLADVNDPRIQTRYHISPEAAAAAMHLVTPDGRVHVGADALARLLRRSSWAWPFAVAWALPGFPWLA